MRNFLAGAALAVLAATAVNADPGGGHGGGHGAGTGGGQGAEKHGGGPDQAKSGGGERHGQQQQTSDIGSSADRSNRHGNRGGGGGRQRDPGRVADRHATSASIHVDRKEEGGNGQWRGDNLRLGEQGAARAARLDGRGPRDSGTPLFARFDGERGLIGGCPPGLAKKHNGCLPPGQARNRDNFQPGWFGLNGLRGDDYRYVDGYLLRYGADHVLGYVPLLGGALSAGNPWPSGFGSAALPDYYRSYYDLGSSDAYRYYDGTIYRVDPQSSAITSIAALLTGDRFTVGQPLPQGYSAYNVPYPYRDRYGDGAEAQYRYNDGYVYRVDPKTQLIAAVIQLLT